MNYLTLVNKENKIKDNYQKHLELIETLNYKEEKVKVETKTLLAFQKLKDYLKEQDINIYIDSAYRSIEEQEKIYQEFKEEYGLEYANKIVAAPKTSEHHTGLAIDIVIMKNNKYIESNEELLKEEEIFETIHKNLADFGFILRYPKTKEKITAYPYEPWHIRYVGPIPAKIIYKNSWTLEEYLQEFSGIILVNKKTGMTSFDVVNEISHIFGIKKVGHTGTLDPLAEGVLIVTIGKATKVVELLTAQDKEYEAGVSLGIKTDTLDITGNIIDKKLVDKNIDIEETLKKFKKTYLQEVPIYSAVKVNGKKLYEYARKNIEVELPKKEVTIKEITLLNTTQDTFTFKATVTKGCYIRSLINDIGTSLNTYATMNSLKRTRQGKISLEKTNTLEEIKKGQFKLYEIKELLDFPTIIVDKELEQKIVTGQKILNSYNIFDKVIFLNKDNKLLGIYQKENGLLRTWKNFV